MTRCRCLSLGTVLLLLIPATAVIGQDAGAVAAQQAAQQAQQAAQQAAAEAQRANDRAIRDAQQAQQNAANTSAPASAAVAYTSPVQFSVRQGVVAKGTTLRLKSRTHYAVIYYTTNGWSPTTESTRYTGPIAIDATMKVQTMAIAPDMVRSMIRSASYTVPGTAASAVEGPLLTDGVLRAGTTLRLVTGAVVNSKTAQVGDPLNLLLDQDVKVGETVVVPRGTAVKATITQADHAGAAGTPGDLAFEVHSLELGGRQIPLRGGESIEGPNHYGRTMGTMLVPVVGMAGLAIHGGEAEIRPGMVVTAAVAGDTSLQP